MTDSGQSFGQHVEQPPPDELVGVKTQHSGLAGGAGSPAQHHLTSVIQAQQPTRRERTAVHVSRQITQRGAPVPGGLEVHVPQGGRLKRPSRFGAELGVNLRVLVLQRLLQATAEPGGPGRRLWQDG